MDQRRPQGKLELQFAPVAFRAARKRPQQIQGSPEVLDGCRVVVGAFRLLSRLQQIGNRLARVAARDRMVGQFLAVLGQVVAVERLHGRDHPAVDRRALLARQALNQRLLHEDVPE